MTVRGLVRAGTAFGAFLGALGLAQACGGTTTIGKKIGPGNGHDGGPGGDGAVIGHTGNRFVDQLNVKRLTKVDLLLMVDNSIGMADKQAVFSEAVPELVQRFASPLCVDPATGIADRSRTPADAAAACPTPLVREFAPIRNVHLGIITSSLGGHGSTTLCFGSDSGTVVDQEMNDHGWLVGKRPRYRNPANGWPADAEGFLDWNPDIHANEIVSQFGLTATAMTLAAGEYGCGLESQLESIYRFLADPNPYDSISTQNCPGSSEPCAVPTGKDMNLLAQRAAFLRPDSLVAVIMLTDENDCSIRESGQYYYAARDNIILPHGSSACIQNPNDKCCYFCNAAVPAGCAPDPACQTPTPRDQDQPNLRCFHQLQRFGFDFLYPTQRYVNALSQPQICTSRADLAADPANCKDLDGDKQPDIFPNPLFTDSSGSTAIPRDPSLVFLAGILGVPWQDLQTSVSPDGSAYPPNELHFRTARQLTDDNTWSVILGDDNPANNSPPVPPTDNLMIESKDPRGGQDGETPPRPLVGTNGGYLANQVNGHEYVNSDQDDLQYACIFKLPQSRDCAALVTQNPAPGCDCTPGKEVDNNPLCQAQNGQYSTTQGFAKAYPGLRELKVLEDFGNNSIVASICPRNVAQPSAPDFGYRPAIDAVLEAIGPALRGRCLPRVLSADPTTGQIPCWIVEVTPAGADSCIATAGRTDVDADTKRAVLARLKETGFCGIAGTPNCSAYSVCQIQQAGNSCHRNEPPTETGWCYIDPAENPADDPNLVAGCPATQRRLIRFVDPLNQTPASDATVLISCEDARLGD